jgi:Polyphosphate kinase N-terminal domain
MLRPDVGVSEAIRSTHESDLPQHRYLDLEESCLRCNHRVLELAEDESVALLERIRFLAIFASNELFMVLAATMFAHESAVLGVHVAAGFGEAGCLGFPGWVDDLGRMAYVTAPPMAW